MRVKIKTKNKSKGKNSFLIGGLNWKGKKIITRKKKNEEQIRKKCITNLDWMMKSIIIIFFRKALRKKIDIKRNKMTLKKKLYMIN